MSQRTATARVLYAGAIAAVALLLLALLAGRGTMPAQGDRPPANVGGQVVLTIPRGGQVLVTLPDGWGITRRAHGTLTLASPRTCHTATLTAFVDRAAEPPATRAEHLVGYLTGRDFNGQRLWRGTTAGGTGYAVYDPPSLLGVEAVRGNPQSIVIIVHGLATHRRCPSHAAAAPRWELSRLLQNLRLRGPAPVVLPAAPEWMA
jgi:hypothetical protein